MTDDCILHFGAKSLFPSAPRPHFGSDVRRSATPDP
jgi:hypothetical protein